MSSALNLLRKKTDKEGFMKKNRSAKGKDEVRSGWQERWFVLKGHTLEYFKKRGDNTAKGIVDLRYAKVDPADERTGKEFTIRIHQSKQIFNYLQTSSAEDQESWLNALRKAAGYRMEEIDDRSNHPKTQFESFCSIGTMYKPTATADALEHTVLMFDASEAMIKVFSEGRCLRKHGGADVSGYMVSPAPDTKSPRTGQIALWSVAVTYKSASYQTHRSYHFGSEKAAREFGRLLQHVSEGNFQPVKLILRRPPVLSGFVQMRNVVNEARWDEMWLVLVEQRCLIFKDETATVPWRSVWIDGTPLKKDGRVGLIVDDPTQKYIFRFPEQEQRDVWHQSFQAAATTLKERIDAGIMGPAPGVPPPSTSPGAGQDVLPGPPPLPSAGGAGAAAAARPGVAASGGAAAAAHSSGALPVGWVGPAPDPSSSSATFVISWGRGSDGQLGLRGKDDMHEPAIVSSLRGKASLHVAAGGTHGLATVSARRTMFVWGNGEHGQLGLGDGLRRSNSPYLITSLSRVPVLQVACGREHSLALGQDGAVYSWGSTSYSQIGRDASVEPATYPKPIVELRQLQTRLIAAGGDHSAAATATGDLYFWGRNSHGQLGLGHTEGVPRPAPHPLSARIDVTQIALGDLSSAVVTRDGTLYTFGSNSHGQLGHGDTRDRYAAEIVPFFADAGLQVSHVAIGAYHGVACTSDGAAYSWGAERFNGRPTGNSAPLKVDSVSNVRAVAASSTHSLLLDGDGRVVAMGTNADGELGNGDPSVEGVFPLHIDPGCKVAFVAAGDGFSIAIVHGEPPARLVPTGTKPKGFEEQSAPVSSAAPSVAHASREIADLLAKSNVMPEQQFVAEVVTVRQQEPQQPQPVAEVVTVHQEAPQPAKKKKSKTKKPMWKEAIDPASGNKYWYHRKTREARWTEPTPEEQAQALADWEAKQG